MTLPLVLAELARRQEERERQQFEGRNARAVITGREGSAHGDRHAREATFSKEEVRVNIGSIVVQVEAEPAERAAQSLPQPRQRAAREVRENSDRWARSFLDR